MMWENVLFILLHVVVLFFQYHLLKRLSIPHGIFLQPLLYTSWTFLCWFISGLFILFHTMEYYSDIKTDEVMIHATTLKTLCYVKEARKKRLHIIWLHLYEMSRMSKSMETVNKLVVQGVGRGDGEGPSPAETEKQSRGLQGKHPPLCTQLGLQNQTWDLTRQRGGGGKRGV